MRGLLKLTGPPSFDVELLFEPRDAWIGLYVDRQSTTTCATVQVDAALLIGPPRVETQRLKLYVCLVPFLPIVLTIYRGDALKKRWEDWDRVVNRGLARQLEASDDDAELRDAVARMLDHDDQYGCAVCQRIHDLRRESPVDVASHLRYHREEFQGIELVYLVPHVRAWQNAQVWR